MSLELTVGDLIRTSTGAASSIRSWASVSGGCIHRVRRVDLEDGRRFLLKSGRDCHPELFDREAEGLRALAGAAAIRVPEVLGSGGGSQGVPAFILMEFIPTGTPGTGFFEAFGRSVARLHQSAIGEGFGFPHDNFLGATPQPNSWRGDWVEFWRDSRLGFQLDLARRQGLSDPRLDRLGDRLKERLGEWLQADDGPPQLLHGDLWSGNFLCDSQGRPAIIDPAAYYGRGEAELAMCRLFGGFGAAFYQAYHEVLPSPPGAQERREIYQLYHLLNHLNLFGLGYYSSCLEILRRYGR